MSGSLAAKFGCDPLPIPALQSARLSVPRVYPTLVSYVVSLADCSMRATPFTRPTLVAAVEFLQQHTQAAFDQLVLRLGLEKDITSGTATSVARKCALLGQIVVQSSDSIIDTLYGSMTLGEAVVREAVQLAQRTTAHPLQIAFARGLMRDGYVFVWDDYAYQATLRAALPSEFQLPEADDELRQLLKEREFSTPMGHLEQAVSAHTRGDWAAANSQIRTFMESLFDDIAHSVRPNDSPQCRTPESRRALLAKIGFLASDRNEWTQDGKNYINGLFKMLHTEGSHPGLSDEDHCTFRLHLALVTARTFLRRLQYDF